MKKIPWSYRINRLASSGIDLIFPPVCGGCKIVGSHWCETCQSRVPRIDGPFCLKCGIPIKKEDAICDSCKMEPPLYRVMRSWAVFESPLQEALHTLKYRKNTGIAYHIAFSMAGYVRSLEWNVDIMIPVPLSAMRLKERGYNQVGKIAEALAYELGIDYMPAALTKTRETRSQVGLRISERRENVVDAFHANIPMVKGKSVLLVDDVSTTGATIRECAGVLLASGASDVYVLTIARALSHHDMNRV